MNGALEFAGEALACLAADKTRGQIAQVFEDRPEKLLCHFRAPHLITIRKIVARGRRGATDAGQRSAMQPQGITYVIETDRMGELRVEQRDHMTPRTITPALSVDFGFTCELGNQELRNQIANLPQQIQFRNGWNDFVFFFYPCRVAGRSDSFQLFRQFLWDGCEI